MFYTINRYLLLVICLILIEIIVGCGRPITKNRRPDMRYNQNKNDGRMRENMMYGRNLDNSYDMRYHLNQNNGALLNSIIYMVLFISSMHLPDKTMFSNRLLV